MRMRTRERTGVEKLLRLLFLAVVNRNYSAREKHNAEEKARASRNRARKARLHAIAIVLRDFPLRAALFTHGASITKQRDEGVPHRHEQEQKRKRHVHEQPAVQPVLDAHLCIGETALLTPAAHFIDARSIHFVDTQFQVAKNFICFARITEAIFFAASGTQVREQELLDETGEHFLL